MQYGINVGARSSARLKVTRFSPEEVRETEKLLVEAHNLLVGSSSLPGPTEILFFRANRTL